VNKGIQMDFTIPYTPQHNRKAERLNRTLVEKVRALLLESKMDRSFWGEALYTAAYLFNRTPSAAIETTPVQKWTGRKPDMKRIRVFGATAYAKTLGPLKKLEDRSKSYKMIGYLENGYRLWDEEKHKVTVARNVIVDEKENCLSKESETGPTQIEITVEIEENLVDNDSSTTTEKETRIDRNSEEPTKKQQ
ncbi:Copia protein, partial [Dufourea novaeangliae]